MQPIAHGVDLVPVRRIAHLRARHPERFTARCFTREERAYCLAQTDRRIDEHLAVRFAAKEAVLKALGVGWAGGVAWTDVAVRRDAGPPRLVLTGEAARIAERQGVRAWLLSLSHSGGDDSYALASTIALG